VLTIGIYKSSIGPSIVPNPFLRYRDGMNATTTTPEVSATDDRVIHGIEGLDAPPAMEITALGAEPSAAAVSDFSSTGVGVVRGLVTQQEIAEIRGTFQAAGDKGPVEGLSDASMLDPEGAGKDAMLRRFPRMLHPHRHPDTDFGKLALRWMIDQRIARVLQGLMGEEPVACQSMYYFKGPGAAGQSLHQDNLFLNVRPGTCVAAWIAVDDCDEENGCLVVVPGTGGWRVICGGWKQSAMAREEFWGDTTLDLPDGCEPIPATMKAGDVLFFNGSIVHGSYRNRSADRFRRSLIFHYAPRSCEQVGEFYHPLLDMQGNPVDRAAVGGGPCG
jgi:ectoine hydroxylase-related dioxygenase (phytanoyl-CoA dioxygenase family)